MNPLLRLRWRLWFPEAWFLGFQRSSDMCGTKWMDFFVVPGIAFGIGWYWL